MLHYVVKMISKLTMYVLFSEIHQAVSLRVEDGVAAATAGVTTTPARGHVNVVVHAMFL